MDKHIIFVLIQEKYAKDTPNGSAYARHSQILPRFALNIPGYARYIYFTHNTSFSYYYN